MSDQADATLSVDEDLERRRSREEGAITEEALALLRRRIGQPVPYRKAAFEWASVDPLRNYARGIGDVNPFYRDLEHAEASRWGTLTAHPTFMLYMGMSRERELSPQLLATGRGDPLRGVHAFYAAEEMQWFSPIRAGDRLEVRQGLAAVDDKTSSMGKRAIHEHHEGVYRNQADELVGLRRYTLIRMERAKARGGKKHAELQVPQRYTEDQMRAIDEDYAREYIRGPEPRYWESVEIGDVSVPLVRGPYTTTAYICYAEATGPRNDYHRAHSDAYRYRSEHPRAFPLNEHGFPDTIARVHWDKEMATRAGLPETYDFGGERVAWMSNVVTNWMGDDAFLRRLRVEMRAFCYVGDTVWLTARVVDKRVDGDDHAVDLELEAINQRDEQIARGTATVLLPSESCPDEPTVPSVVPDGLSPFL